MTKCVGCGAILQDKSPDDIGYIKDINKDLCLRCFRIKNYNDYKIVLKDNNDYIKILKEINKTNDLVLLVVDIFDIPYDLKSIRNYFDNDLILVITKRDILPKSVYEEKLLNYFDKYNLNDKARVIVSSKNNYHFDLLFSLINEYKKGKNVYVVGYTNAGKSSLINKLIYNYSDLNANLTVSSMPSTTIDTLNIDINDNLSFIDTPGLISDGSIINIIDGKLIKRITPKKEINPIVYQIKNTQYIDIDNMLKIEASNNNLVLYFSNELNIERLYKNNDNNYKKKYAFNVKSGHDIVVPGFGFIKCLNDGIINIYMNYELNIYERDSLI